METRKAYEDMFKVLLNKTQQNYDKAFEYLLQFLVADHLPQYICQFEGKLSWLLDDEELYHKLVEIYKNNFKAIHEDHSDPLGDMYIEMQGKFSQSNKGQFFTPVHVCRMIAQMTMQKTDEVIRVCDPCVGTGRLLRAGAEIAPNALFYGIDIDNRVLRIAFTNACIHKYHLFVICADSLKHATDQRTKAGRHNWGFANRWYSHYAEMKPLSEEFGELCELGLAGETMLGEYRKRKAQTNLGAFGGVVNALPPPKQEETKRVKQKQKITLEAWA